MTIPAMHAEMKMNTTMGHDEVMVDIKISALFDICFTLCSCTRIEIFGASTIGRNGKSMNLKFECDDTGCRTQIGLVLTKWATFRPEK